MPELTPSAAADPDEYVAGALIDGKYLLERPLGEGGQAFVWQARHVELDSHVAIKIAVGARDEPERGARLLLEGRAVSRIGHPAIAKVFDVGRTPAGDPFLVMELLEGETLLTAITRAGRLSPIDTLRLMLPIAHALTAAHAEGLVHRDVKPENVFLARTGSGSGIQPKLLDFGVVKVLDRRKEGITAAGAIIGSPAFLSPEQARGEASVDERSDAWSFCVTVYVCLTGKLPFACQTYHRLVRSILEDEPISILDLGVGDEELWAILSRGLSKSIEQRWSSMRELGAAFASWLLSRGIEKDACDSDLASEWCGGDEPKSRVIARVPSETSPPARSNRHPLSRSSLTLAGLAMVAAGSLAASVKEWSADSPPAALPRSSLDPVTVAPALPAAVTTVSAANDVRPDETAPPPGAPRAASLARLTPSSGSSNNHLAVAIRVVDGRPRHRAHAVMAAHELVSTDTSAAPPELVPAVAPVSPEPEAKPEPAPKVEAAPEQGPPSDIQTAWPQPASSAAPELINPY
jgi:serine/threonine protein kinase